MWWCMVVALLASRGLALFCLSKHGGSKVLLNGEMVRKVVADGT